MASTVVAPPVDDPRTRGRLTIPQRVVQRIAAQAASEIAAAGGRAGGLLGLGGRVEQGARPKVTATLSSESVDLAIELALDYPVSLRTAARQVRDHVAERVRTLTGVAVHRIDLTVVAVGLADRADSEGLR
ncbi:Asp23/Gls24 family envelope stress response protein [Microlunatus parietis]|uniref:Putative alkaline shock family protein YloU n=1 Tax=Microlunatus parietis TaxID=682979 RepID=A0A7Y9I846_9ACTN|nr:Asp23/Gls24 family envelope stress response protein [Microlunatus parietis]NYE71937.1 putative alkaline shock family protein YloU [Microlunatus parietis]